MRHQLDHQRGRNGERGSALTWALLFVVITSGMIVSHSIFLAANRRDMDVRFRQSTLASSFARSGAMDALGWFQKQGVQPVQAFTPQQDGSSNPPITDTIDPSVGLVREFQVRGGLWGRYEVRKSEVADISSQRGMTPNSGQVWDIGAHGFLYELVDPTKAYDAAPNRIVSMTSLRSEMRGIKMLPPAEAALCIQDGAKLEVGPMAKIGGARRPAVAYSSGGGPMATIDSLPTSILSGTPKTIAVPNYRATPQGVFSMPLEVLKSMSDFAMDTDSAGLPRGGLSGLPSQIGDYKILFVDGSLKLDSSTSPLVGKLVIIVTGEMKVDGACFVVSGLLWVGGRLEIQGPATFKGTIIAGDEVKIGTTGGSVVSIKYDSTVLDLLRQEVGRYRFSRSFYFDDGTTSIK